MENIDREVILEMLKTNAQLKRLYDQHEEIERKLDSLKNRVFMTSAEEMQVRYLKKVKLHGVDRMMLMIADNRIM